MNFLLKGWYPCQALGWRITTEINFQAKAEDDPWKIVDERFSYIRERKLYREIEQTK